MNGAEGCRLPRKERTVPKNFEKQMLDFKGQTLGMLDLLVQRGEETRTEVGGLRSEVGELRSEVGHIRAGVDRVERRLGRIENRLDEFEPRGVRSERRLDALEPRVSALEAGRDSSPGAP